MGQRKVYKSVCFSLNNKGRPPDLYNMAKGNHVSVQKFILGKSCLPLKSTSLKLRFPDRMATQSLG